MHLKNLKRYQNPRAFPSYLLSLTLSKKMPLRFLNDSGLMARIVNKDLDRGELVPACKLIANLIRFELKKNRGIKCGAIKVVKNIGKENGENCFSIEKLVVAYPLEDDLRNLERELTKEIYNRYNIIIKLGKLPPETGCKNQPFYFAYFTNY